MKSINFSKLETVKKKLIKISNKLILILTYIFNKINININLLLIFILKTIYKLKFYEEITYNILLNRLKYTDYLYLYVIMLQASLYFNNDSRLWVYDFKHYPKFGLYVIIGYFSDNTITNYSNYNVVLSSFTYVFYDFVKIIKQTNENFRKLNLFKIENKFIHIKSFIKFEYDNIESEEICFSHIIFYHSDLLNINNFYKNIIVNGIARDFINFKKEYGNENELLKIDDIQISFLLYYTDIDVD